MKLINTDRKSLSLLAFTRPDRSEYAAPGETEEAFALVSFQWYANCKGVRFCLFSAPSSGNIDFPGRSLLGLVSSDGALVIEILFMKIAIA